MNFYKGYCMYNKNNEYIFSDNKYFGSYNLQYGAMGSVLDLPRLAHSKIKIYGGIEEEICDRILKEFFEKIRR